MQADESGCHGLCLQTATVMWPPWRATDRELGGLWLRTREGRGVGDSDADKVRLVTVALRAAIGWIDEIVFLSRPERMEKSLEISASFLVGVAHFVLDSHEPSDDETRQIEIVEEALSSLADEDFTCSLSVEGSTVVASSLEEDYATADDREGLPVLLYIVASFELPDELVDELPEDEDELLQLVSITLRLGNKTFDHVSEIEIL